MDINKIEDFLVRAKHKDKIANAYIIYGGEAEDRKRLAAFLSMLVNCAGAPPCLECSSCRQVNGGVHPDVKWILPAKSILSIDDVRAVKENIYITPYAGGKKVYIFHVDYMRDESANALLKILEEPPFYAVLVILSSNLNFFLPTIISRCQKLRLNYRLPDNLSGFTTSQNEFAFMLERARQKKFFEFFRAVDAFVKKSEREDVERWLGMAAFMYRDMLMGKYKMADTLLLKTEAGAGIEGFDKDGCVKALEYLLEMKDRVKYNINLKLGLESLFLQMIELK